LLDVFDDLHGKIPTTSFLRKLLQSLDVLSVDLVGEDLIEHFVDLLAVENRFLVANQLLDVGLEDFAPVV